MPPKHQRTTQKEPTTNQSFLGRSFFRGSILVGIMLVAGAAALYLFSAHELRPDEAYRVWQASQVSPVSVIGWNDSTFENPLHLIILKTVNTIFPDNPMALRIMSMLFFLATIPAMYALTKRAYGHTAAIVGALLTALSPLVLLYALDIHAATLFLLLSVLNMYFFIGIMSPERRLFDRIGFGITAVLGLYTHILFIAVLVAQLLFAFAFNRRASYMVSARRTFFAIGIVTVMLVGIISPQYVSHEFDTYFSTRAEIEAPADEAFTVLSLLLLGYQGDSMQRMFISLWPLFLLISLLTLHRSGGFKTATAYTPLFLLVIALSVTILIVFGSRNADDVTEAVYAQRFFPEIILLAAAPALYAIVSWIVSLYPRRFFIATVILLVMLVGASAYTQQAYANNALAKKYNEAAQFLQMHVTPRDVILVQDRSSFLAITYHENIRASAVVFDSIRERLILDHNRRMAIDSGDQEAVFDRGDALPYERIWLIIDVEEAPQIRDFMDARYERLYEMQYDPAPYIFLYRVRYDTGSLEEELQYIQATRI